MVIQRERKREKEREREREREKGVFKTRIAYASLVTRAAVAYCNAFKLGSSVGAIVVSPHDGFCQGWDIDTGVPAITMSHR